VGFFKLTLTKSFFIQYFFVPFIIFLSFNISSWDFFLVNFSLVFFFAFVEILVRHGGVIGSSPGRDEIE